MDLPRAARATRGQRLTRLVKEDEDADEVFWSQHAFKDERNDREYEEEAEAVDEFDSDFDEAESDAEEEAPDEREYVPKKKRKLPYKKPSTDKKKKKKSVSFLLGASEKQQPKSKKSAAAKSKQQQHADEDQETGEKTSLRKSTRTAVVVRQAEREAIQAVMQALPKPAKRKKGEEKRLSQEDMLLEAAQTEVINLQSLERMLAREEEVKKRAIILKSDYNGPQIRYFSKDGYTVLEFTKVQSFPAVINSKAPQYPEKAICAVTGLPAKYRDPKTGLPYATKEAFKILRERVAKGGKRDCAVEESHQRKRTKVEMERASRAGAVKLKFKKTSPPPPLIPTPLPPPPPPPALAAPPVPEMEESDFMLEDLEVKLPEDDRNDIQLVLDLSSYQWDISS